MTRLTLGNPIISFWRIVVLFNIMSGSTLMGSASPSLSESTSNFELFPANQLDHHCRQFVLPKLEKCTQALTRFVQVQRPAYLVPPFCQHLVNYCGTTATCSGIFENPIVNKSFLRPMAFLLERNAQSLV